MSRKSSPFRPFQYHETALPLFDGEAYARALDPDSSHSAAVHVRGKEANRLETLILRILETHPSGLNNHEICNLTGLTWNTATPRIAPLVRKRLVMDSGRRRRGPSNRSCVIWIAT